MKGTGVMKVIGLTGGMGTGKSTVAAYLREKGIPVIDADAIAHQVTEKDSPLLPKIRRLLGDDVFEADGSMRRQAVADKIFHDPTLLQPYQKLATGEVIRRCCAEIETFRQKGRTALLIVDAPLLFESGFQAFTDENWLVTAEMGVRIERIKQRDSLPEQEIMDRINHQMSTEEKAKMADYCIDNSTDLQLLYARIDQLLEREDA